jgi:predicted AAA+ superfamily ATPase
MVEEALADTRVITVNGARQAGRSTLARLAAAARPGSVVRLLDDPATLRSATDDPAGFVEHDGLLVIDEVQLAPELFRSIKVAVDTDPRPGQFLLTGSAQVLALRALPDALPGRMEIIERDVSELAAIERRGDLRRLLALLAGRSGSLLVPATLATASGISRTTLGRYLELLSAVFLVKQVPPWTSGHTRRAVGTPELAFVDTGIAAHLIGQDATRLGGPDGASGPLVETFVLSELARQLPWSTERPRLYHHRTKDKVEVDAVLETPDGRVIGVEVKAGATVRSEDLAGLRHLAARLGPRFVAGYVLYAGQQTLPFGDRLRALPIDVLWEAAP